MNPTVHRVLTATLLVLLAAVATPVSADSVPDSVTVVPRTALTAYAAGGVPAMSAWTPISISSGIPGTLKSTDRCGAGAFLLGLTGQICWGIHRQQHGFRGFFPPNYSTAITSMPSSHLPAWESALSRMRAHDLVPAR